MAKFFKRGMEVTFTVDDFTLEGRGVGHLRPGDQVFSEGGSAYTLGKGDAPVGFTIFTSHVLPGDRVRVRLGKTKKRYGEGDLLTILEKSPDRVDPPCPHAHICGGCPFIALTRDRELAFKQSMVRDVLERIGRVDGQDLGLPEMVSRSEWAYRKKVNLRVNPDGLLSYTQSASMDLFPIEKCPIVRPEIQDKIDLWQEEAGKNPRFRAIVRKVRMIVIRVSSLGETLCFLITDPIDDEDREELFGQLSPLAFDVLAQSANAQEGDVTMGEEVFFATPKTSIREDLMGYHFFISPPSFFQINGDIAPLLYDQAIRLLAGPEDGRAGDRVLDLYCGTGTTSLLLSGKVNQVLGIEILEEAVEDGREACRANGVDNVSFLPGRVEDLLASPVLEDMAPKKALVDPPRKGLDPRALEAIGNSTIQDLVYISCNPATLARDIEALSNFSFSLEFIRLYDMFPKTSQVEALTLLVRDSHSESK
ncbi:23S rRNA (uracil(1939)-C(5))-methyltransferase RlmD [Kallipyga massiliensis]|uniref:23S rRNA (uracil(1939)-C(5))-methyltransferase RlmD n=1 Tax=Kallipyga massiliensis TaxID=1472764 RepID=UPI0004B3A053|nr:23S rRNA (uracil(1939)-C(5))-methyltransferase RlmD [Kallipyga massiliensis]